MPGPNMISPEQLMRLIGTPDCPVIIDARLPDDIAPIDRGIPSAIHREYNDIIGISERIAKNAAVIICHKGLKISQGVAALLRSNGNKVEVLDGGFVAWSDRGLPTVPLANIPASHLWVTRHRPKIDRIACPWLIRRFIDPDAQFMFAPPADVIAVADRFDAISFDVDGADYRHIGENCSFDALISGFNLSNPALNDLAKVVHAADTNSIATSPQAAGLLAISIGLSKVYRDDNAQLEAGMLIYDALFRWARDGQDEGHSS